MILIVIGFSLYLYVYKKKDYKENLIDKNNSPIQLINQITGYFYINPYLSICFAVTLFSFVGIPPIAGFFAKQMILSAALDSGYVFMSLVAIITSVIGAGYYLNLIKQIFFFKDNYKKNISITNLSLAGYIVPVNMYNTKSVKKEQSVSFNPENIIINGSFSSAISVITLLLILFIYMPEQ